MKFTLALLLCLFSTVSFSIDEQTIKFVAGKADKLASQGKNQEAFAELGWLISSVPPQTFHLYIEPILQRYPDISNTQVDAISDQRLTAMTCNGKTDIDHAQAEARRMIDNLRRFADGQKIIEAEARIERFFSNTEPESIERLCAEYRKGIAIAASQESAALAEAETKSAPGRLRKLDSDSFCALYGKHIRGISLNGYSHVIGLGKLFSAEANRRNVNVDKALVKAERIKIGIGRCSLVASWGQPQDINQSVGTWGSHSQFVYGNFGPYVYVRNGVVDSFQK